jgi:hypothetical protein
LGLRRRLRAVVTVFRSNKNVLNTKAQSRKERSKFCFLLALRLCVFAFMNLFSNSIHSRRVMARAGRSACYTPST